MLEFDLRILMSHFERKFLIDGLVRPAAGLKELVAKGLCKSRTATKPFVGHGAVSSDPFTLNPPGSP
jgi:hypothetical protein